VDRNDEVSATTGGKVAEDPAEGQRLASPLVPTQVRAGATHVSAGRIPSQ